MASDFKLYNVARDPLVLKKDDEVHPYGCPCAIPDATPGNSNCNASTPTEGSYTIVDKCKE